MNAIISDKEPGKLVITYEAANAFERLNMNFAPIGAKGDVTLMTMVYGSGSITIGSLCIPVIKEFTNG